MWNVGSVPQIILISLQRQFSMRLSSDLLQRVAQIELYIPSPRHGRGFELSLTSGVSTEMTNQTPVSGSCDPSRPIRGQCLGHPDNLHWHSNPLIRTKLARYLLVDDVLPQSFLFSFFSASILSSARPQETDNAEWFGAKKLYETFWVGVKRLLIAASMFVTGLRMGWRCHDS